MPGYSRCTTVANSLGPVISPTVNMRFEYGLVFFRIAQDVLHGIVEGFKCRRIPQVHQPLSLERRDRLADCSPAAFLRHAHEVHDGIDVVHRGSNGGIPDDAEAAGCMKQELAYCEVVDDEEMFLHHRRFLPVAHGELLALLLGVDVNVAAGEMEVKSGMARRPIGELLASSRQVLSHVMLEHEIPARCVLSGDPPVQHLFLVNLEATQRTEVDGSFA